MSVAESEHGQDHKGVVNLPTPTSWPIVLSLGITLLLSGLVTNWVISLLGVVLMLMSTVGWFRQVLPHEQHVGVPVTTRVETITSRRTNVIRIPISEDHRQVLPYETYTMMAGVKGGIAGGLAMIVPATLYGLVRYHSIWYSMNLLAAGGFVSWANASNAFLAAFHPEGLLAALAIHIVTSLLVGLLYGAMLPMFPWKPIFTAGFAAPFLWTGILYSALGVISPILDQRIDWLWFVVSQITFGLVCGFVVNLQVQVRTEQFRSLPFTLRAGLEGAHKREGEDEE
ncbi:hypothetical protein [Edaphobacter dinghuensis]|uniref:Uncharacterized protein n=1 Tax=Edaphobacter dinghuensis TaxID=1560005 RepID=A0A917HIX8_9BACT|nr:hypothetical protein [Edaphobacter dinghuensis]GGG80017.1 hypothetical protein GCM10011585_24170 [Edaphobacter dinghuensis]